MNDLDIDIRTLIDAAAAGVGLRSCGLRRRNSNGHGNLRWSYATARPAQRSTSRSGGHSCRSARGGGGVPGVADSSHINRGVGGAFLAACCPGRTDSSDL